MIRYIFYFFTSVMLIAIYAELGNIESKVNNLNEDIYGASQAVMMEFYRYKGD